MIVICAGADTGKNNVSLLYGKKQCMSLRNCGTLGARVGSAQGHSLATPQKPAQTPGQQQCWVPAVVSLMPRLVPFCSSENARVVVEMGVYEQETGAEQKNPVFAFGHKKMLLTQQAYSSQCPISTQGDEPAVGTWLHLQFY